MVFTTNNNLSAPQFMDFTVNTKFLPILVFTDFTINDNLLPLKFLEFTNNTNKFSQELVVPTLCLLPVISVSVMPRLNLRLKQRLSSILRVSILWSILRYPCQHLPSRPLSLCFSLHHWISQRLQHRSYWISQHLQHCFDWISYHLQHSFDWIPQHLQHRPYWVSLRV